MDGQYLGITGLTTQGESGRLVWTERTLLSQEWILGKIE